MVCIMEMGYEYERVDLSAITCIANKACLIQGCLFYKIERVSLWKFSVCKHHHNLSKLTKYSLVGDVPLTCSNTNIKLRT